ncbi:hypothetical protein [Burkholderia sp. 9120]|uniref:hypothetical protein n=1 Tax=Burkholderia sp. 9120 TaxID=1500897 RepID=UPI0005532079|nr:hypothetical protein [Burkholderia sp. 9120]
MQSNAASSSTAVDRFSARHFARWIGFLIVCFGLWEFDKGVIAILLTTILLFPPLFVVWVFGSMENAVRRRWRSAASAFLAPLLAVGLVLGLPFVGIDSERIHFLLVKYPHEIELHFSSNGGKAFHSWSWGLNAAPFSPGVAYTLNYDPTDAELLAPKVPEKSVRPMGNHFYVVRESEDGSPL